MSIKRGEIYLAALDPVVGREISKTRPVGVVSNDTNNEFSGTVTILLITSKNVSKIYPFNYFYPREAVISPKIARLKRNKFAHLIKPVLSRK